MVVTNSAATVTYPATAYEINAALGMIKVLSTGAIVDGESLKVDYIAAAISGTKVLGGTKPTVKGRVLLDGINLATSQPVIVRVDEASLGPDGEIDFSSEKFVSVTLAGEMRTLTGKTSPYTVEFRGV